MSVNMNVDGTRPGHGRRRSMVSPGDRRGHSVASRRRGGQSAVRRSVPAGGWSFEEEEEEAGEDRGAAGHQRSRDVDATLIFASLDREVAAEDEAEAALLEVLERRQVPFADLSPFPEAATGLTSSGERAKRIASTMKPVAASIMEHQTVAGAGLSGLMHVLEAHRDNDHDSSGSAHRSRGAGSGGGVRRRLSRSTSGLSASGGSGKASQSRLLSGEAPSPFSQHVARTVTGMERWFRAAEQVQELYLDKIPEGGEEEEETSAASEVLAEENATFLSQLAASHPDVSEGYTEETGGEKHEAGAANERTPILQHAGRMRSRWSIARCAPLQTSRLCTLCRWWTELRRQAEMMAAASDFGYVRERLWVWCKRDFALGVVPALAVSAFLFYRLNNPSLPVLPSDASLSWCILYGIRHYLTLQMAYSMEYFVVDVLATGTLLAVQLVGPLATLYAINSKGWPCILTMWGVFNLILNQEGDSDKDHAEFDHWLSFTGIEMFTAENPSGGVAESEMYRQILLSMIVAGVATTMKRTSSALYLGQRVYSHYKPRLEKVMESMILLNEVANLGNAIDDFVEGLDSPTKENRASEPTRLSKDSSLLNDKVNTTTLLRGKASPGDSANTRLRSKNDVSNDIDNVAKENEVNDEAAVPTSVNKDEKDWLGSTEGDFLGEEPPAMDNDEQSSQIGILQHTSATTQVKDHLDSWKEPVNKQDKIPDPTIQDILMFRKAMQFLNDMQPFGASFGPAFTRDLCIESSKSLYKRLLSLSPGAIVLPFDVICVLAFNMDGSLDDKKAASLAKLFRPDKYNKVSFLSFVQSCDSVYKNLRYLRASHGNSILIDGVLESIFNSVFFFFLGLTVLSMLHLNPWTLLVSLSTVLVSFAFAMGPSAAKMVEGMILIAIRRPFDLGDRISIVDNTSAPDNNSDDPGYHNTWIVEDVTLFTTTLRFSRTNEVSTVNNGSIANSRIVNHGRSHNALVNVSLPVRIDTTSDQIQIVQSALEQYIKDIRAWVSLVSFGITQVDPANDLIVYSARIQHFKSWQDLTGVLQARGDLEKFCTEILIKLDIQYGGPIAKNNVFVKEFPENMENLPFTKV